MKSSKETIQSLTLEYDSGIIPPPYSHVFHMELDWSGARLSVKLDLHYTDREELSEEEILDEGFTLDDDYHFEGELNSVWIEPIQALYQENKWSPRQLDEGGIVLYPGQESIPKTPVNQEAWQLMAQDLIQAIYETNKKEAPLHINYRLVTNEESIDCKITVHFSDRNVILSKGEESESINWDYAIQLMKLIFTPDYHYEIAKEKPGTKRGAYIDCGDGLWHELGKGVVNIDPAFDAVGKIQERFEDLLLG